MDKKVPDKMPDRAKPTEWTLVVHHDGYACPTCGAVVVKDFRNDHDKWHRDLEKELAEIPEVHPLPAKK